MKAPEFLADAKKKGLEIVPMTGEDVQSAVHQVLTTPKDIIGATPATLAVTPR